ncbi:MAG: acyl-CoA synthetase [Acidobacteriota bacterium]
MVIPLVGQAESHGDRIAIVDSRGAFSFKNLLDASHAIASLLLAGAADLCEARVAYLVPSSFDYAAAQWGIWRAGGIAVPLSALHTRTEHEYAVDDCGAGMVITHRSCEAQLRPIAEARGLRSLTIGDVPEGAARGTLPDVCPSRRAMIVYTSGTTSKPKGVVTTHRNIQAQVTTLAGAWGWTESDRILCTLPLHHIHGIINVLTCALWAGASCEMQGKFDAEQVWERFARGQLTLFMGIPTMYARLAAAWDRSPPGRRRAMSAACRRFRLMVSGSAALPVQLFEKWRAISGMELLERYGMTEIGMALSNPLDGERRPGTVGRPLPQVEVRIVDERGSVVEPGVAGEIEVKGPGVFLEYWGKPKATQASFHDGWFRTGDVAAVEDGYHRILGRASVDIIKTGGYKVSALEVEEVLRAHPDVDDCAVVGVADPHLGEVVAAAVQLRPGSDLDPEALKSWSSTRLAPYKVPRRAVLLDSLPRNAMGKTLKSEVARLFTC